MSDANAIPKCKDGCCPQTQPYPTWVTVIAAVGMLFMVACLVFMVLAIVAMLLSSWTISIGITAIPIALILYGVLRPKLSRRT